MLILNPGSAPVGLLPPDKQWRVLGRRLKFSRRDLGIVRNIVEKDEKESTISRLLEIAIETVSERR